ncbi:UNVERIFIED_CONTAM: hypothetical protein PYX00_006508 [Menopon gallinae]|uniref:Uncharacterized protein n=1 Tax=Menopon gallinae TaxID=328185 RepID=A0AAW2HVS1_9NEOP
MNQIVDENQTLNTKLSELSRLEMEKEAFRIEIERLKKVESESERHKKRILEMERELMSQEEEIDSLTTQIKQLSKDYIEESEYLCLKNEIQRQTELLKEKEDQLEEIPILQTEIEELRQKLLKSLDDITFYKQTEVDLKNKLEEYKKKYHKLDEALMHGIVEFTYDERQYEEKKYFQELSAVQETVFLDDLSSPLDRSEDEREWQNKQSNLEKGMAECTSESSSNLIDHDLNEMLQRVHKFKEILDAKNERIKTLEYEIDDLKRRFSNCVACEDLKNESMKLQSDITTLKELNQRLQGQLGCKLEEELRIEKLEDSIKRQVKAVEFFKEELRQAEGKLLSEIINRKKMDLLSKLQKEESLLSKKETCVNYLTEIDNLRSEIDILKKLISELKKENQMLHKMRSFTESTGKKVLGNVLRKLKAQLIVLQNVSKPQLESECQALHAEVKRLVEEADNLKLALDAERKLKDYLEKELNLIQKELSLATKARNKAPKNRNAYTMTEPFVDRSDEIKKTLNDIKLLKKENEEFVKEITDLQNQCQDFQNEVTILQSSMSDLQKGIEAERNTTCMQKDEINALNEKIKLYEKDMADLRSVNDDFQQNSIALREELTAKEAEIDRTKRELTDMNNEIRKLNSEIMELRIQLQESEETRSSQEIDLEKGSDTILRVEKEFEELIRKLENCKTAEEKSTVLRTKRDNLIVKVKSFESEVEFLKKQLIECDLMKSELEQLKAEKRSSKQMNIESEEKLLSDICGLREQLKLQQKEIDHARSENSSLKEKLQELGKVLDVCKNSHKKATGKGDCLSNTAVDSLTEAVRVDSGTNCEKVGDTISVDEFKIEIQKIEIKHKNKVQKLREGNAKKIKRLMAQYEKENKNRNKAYNESLNTIKSNYENDIKKLVEKHKSSILRLQNLHEDEVQELNTNYETQMEAMQTLNENVVNDLTSGAAEKCKLTEKYNKEIRDLESRFQKLLKEKENQHMIEVANLQEDVNRSISELKQAHQKDVENISRVYNENINKLEDKHIKEMKTCKRNNMKKIEVMRCKYEDLLTEERKKFEEQLQIMLNRLKMGQHGDQVEDDLELVYLKAPIAHAQQDLEFNSILQKIINGGLKCLQFDELMLVHCKTCFAADSFFEELNMRVEHDGDLLGNACPHMPLLKEEKEELLKRIFVLENEIAIKQLETHEAIINMESAEKCRIEELSIQLKKEREKNEELKLKVTNQTKAQTDLKIESYMLDRQASIHESNYIETVKELEIARAEKRNVEDELQKEKNNSKRLTLMLENERQRFKSQRKKDSDYIDAMRLRLEEALNHEQIMESQLDYEAQFRTKLELELQSLQRSFNLIIDQPSPAMSLETKTVKDKKNLDQFESEKEEKLGKSRVRSKMRSHKNT